MEFMEEIKLIITFDSVYQALALEDIGRDGRIIPLPTAISAGCASAWATSHIDEDYWKQYLEEQKIEYEKMVVMEI